MSTDCFTCPQPANYAAIALQLQKTAFDAENCIYPLETQLRGAANRPTIVNTTAALTAILPNVRQRFGTNLTTTFSNSEIVNFNAVAPAGVYHIGMWLNATAAGAVTDNSFRHLEIVTRPALAPSTAPDDFSASQVTYESNNGSGMDMQLDTTVVLNGAQDIQFFFTHNNASNINIAAGAILWWTRISDATIPRVVV